MKTLKNKILMNNNCSVQLTIFMRYFTEQQYGKNHKMKHVNNKIPSVYLYFRHGFNRNDRDDSNVYHRHWVTLLTYL